MTASAEELNHVCMNKMDEGWGGRAQKWSERLANDKLMLNLMWFFSTEVISMANEESSLFSDSLEESAWFLLQYLSNKILVQ